MYQQAIVRTPASTLVHGLTSSPDSGRPDYKKALIQHQYYVEALVNCGIEVTILPAINEFPDSCFVEDTVLLTEHAAILTRPGISSRQGEVTLIEPTIQAFYRDRIKRIAAPGTLEAGDVLRIHDHFYIGLSQRTNAEGAKQLSSLLSQYGYSSSMIALNKLLHLKTGVSYLGENCILVHGELIDHPEFVSYEQIIVPDDEAYAANCIKINETLIMPRGFNNTIKSVESKGFHVAQITISEFQKTDGGLSGLSLRF